VASAIYPDQVPYPPSSTLGLNPSGVW